MLTYGRRIPPLELDYRIQAVDAKVVRDACSRYIYDKCPALVGIGEGEWLSIMGVWSVNQVGCGPNGGVEGVGVACEHNGVWREGQMGGM